MASGQYLTNQDTSPFTEDVSAEALANGSLGPQGYINFSELPGTFLIVVSGNDANAMGGQSGTLRVRIGGTLNTVDGDLALEQAYVASAFAAFSVRQVVTNIWTGWKLVKITGQGGVYMQRTSWFFMPVII